LNNTNNNNTKLIRDAWNPLAWDSWLVNVQLAAKQTSLVTVAGFVQQPVSISGSHTQLPKYGILHDVNNPNTRRTPVMIRWDRSGNMIFSMEDRYLGNGAITALHEDELGNIYIAVHFDTTSTTFMRNTTVFPAKSSALIKYSECEAECNRHGYCVPSRDGLAGQCVCFNGWRGDTCAERMWCSHQTHNSEAVASETRHC
jgi:hypothetical protein